MIYFMVFDVCQANDFGNSMNWTHFPLWKSSWNSNHGNEAYWPNMMIMDGDFGVHFGTARSVATNVFI